MNICNHGITKKNKSKLNIQHVFIKSKNEFPQFNQEDTSTSQISSEASVSERNSMPYTLTTQSNQSEDTESWKPKRSRFTRLPKDLKVGKIQEETLRQFSILDRYNPLSSHKETNENIQHDRRKTQHQRKSLLMNSKKVLEKEKKRLLRYDQTKAPVRIEFEKIQPTKSTQQNTLKKFGFNHNFTKRITTQKFR